MLWCAASRRRMSSNSGNKENRGERSKEKNVRHKRRERTSWRNQAHVPGWLHAVLHYKQAGRNVSPKIEGEKVRTKIIE
jgi:hypothetical protein